MELTKGQHLTLEAEAAALLGAVPREGEVDAVTLELLRKLTLHPEQPVQGFLRDLAEVLFVPREARTEYQNHRGDLPPYKIAKLMLEYATLSWRVDHIVGALTKEFCASSCDRPPVGCCHILGYDLGLVPVGMLEVQRLEALRDGVDHQGPEEKCRYHTRRGCTLKLFKSPACVRYICPPMMSYLEQRFGAAPSRLAVFLAALETFGNSHIGRRRVFARMEKLIAAGETLLASEQ